IDLRRDAADVNAARAALQLRQFGSPGTGKWIKKSLETSASEAMLTGEFELADAVDLAGGEALSPPAGLRFMHRPGSYLVGVHDAARKRPFVCHAGRQVETIEVRLPAGFKPSRLPVDRRWQTSMAEYRATYAFERGSLRVRREFASRPTGQVCQPAQSRAGRTSVQHPARPARRRRFRGRQLTTATDDGDRRQAAFGLLGTMQKPWASMPSDGLNLLRKFSSATAAVSSTIWASVKCCLSSAKKVSSTWRSV